MKKTKAETKAEKRQQKNRKRMHLSGGSLRKPNPHAGRKDTLKCTTNGIKM